MRCRLYITAIRLLFLAGAAHLCCADAFSQNAKGAVTENTLPAATGKTRALVIGISKYQFIDSLQYADTDAKVFAEYLKSSSFWHLGKEDITLLVNDKAKYGDLTVNLQQIVLECKPGDNLLFYFSGHGDVETKTMFNRGFLLAHDTYSSNYMANGLRVDDLKDLFVTLLTNNVKVIIVTDACRSGKLAGGMKGAEFTAAAISSIWKNEIKILSSQPGQLSYEDKKWGTGRGVFSYYLIKGLNGEADANKDSSITLSELEMYVGGNVARETNNMQQPIFEGPNKFSAVITKIERPAPVVNPATNKKSGGNNIQLYYKRAALPFDSCEYYYQEMAKAIADNKLLSDDKKSAVFYYQQIKRCSNETGFVLNANARLLSALMNSSQEIVNNSFIGKSLVSYDKFEEGINLIEQIFMYNDLQLPNMPHWKNLKRYLEVQKNAVWYKDIVNKISIPVLDAIIDSAIKEEPEASYLLTAKSVLEMRKENWSIATQLLEKSLEKSPGWLIPRYYLGICYANRRNYKKALEYYEMVLQKDTSYHTFECTKCILLNMSEYSFKAKQYKKGLEYLFKNLDMFPDHWAPYELLYDYALEKKDTSVATDFVKRLKKYDDTASMQLLRLRFENDFFGTALSPSSLEPVKLLLKDNVDSADYFYTLSLYYKDKKNYDEDSVLSTLTKATELDTAEYYYVMALAEFMSGLRWHEEVQELLLKKIPAFTGEEKAQLQEQLANSYLDTDNYEEAFAICKELVLSGYLTCDDLRKMRKTFKGVKAYEQFMKTCKED